MNIKFIIQLLKNLHYFRQIKEIRINYKFFKNNQ